MVFGVLAYMWFDGKPAPGVILFAIRRKDVMFAALPKVRVQAGCGCMLLSGFPDSTNKPESAFGTVVDRKVKLGDDESVV